MMFGASQCSRHLASRRSLRARESGLLGSAADAATSGVGPVEVVSLGVSGEAATVTAATAASVAGPASLALPADWRVSHVSMTPRANWKKVFRLTGRSLAFQVDPLLLSASAIVPFSGGGPLS